MNAPHAHEPSQDPKSLGQVYRSLSAGQLFGAAFCVAFFVASAVVSFLAGTLIGDRNAKLEASATPPAVEQLEAPASNEPDLWIHPASGCVFVIQGAGASRTYTQIEGPDGYNVCNPPAAAARNSGEVAPNEATQ